MIKQGIWLPLEPFGADKPVASAAIKVWIERHHQHTLVTRWQVNVPLEFFRRPRHTSTERRDGLWRTTCFELFVAGKGDPYLEYNLSLSGEWACTRFARYRTAPEPCDIPVPDTDYESDPHWLWFDTAVALPSEFALADLQVNVSAVLEKVDGTLSHWALAHPAERPDFHDRSCFRLTLPAAE